MEEAGEGERGHLQEAWIPVKLGFNEEKNWLAE